MTDRRRVRVLCDHAAPAAPRRLDVARSDRVPCCGSESCQASMLKARLALCVGMLVVVVLLIEAGLRFAPPIPTDKLLPFPYNSGRVEQIVAGDTYLRFDGHLGWAPAP